VLETRTRRSGRARRVPLARGPRDGNVLWLIAVHGSHAAFVRNLLADPRVRVKSGGRWRTGTATVEPYDDTTAARFNAYGRSGPRTFGIDPVLIRIELFRSR
jgi:deazaflavin-dependent oxidoreductase (nitroreductase family)